MPCDDFTKDVLQRLPLAQAVLLRGLAVAMATAPDGQTNEAKLAPQLLPQVRPHFAGILWLADRQFGNPA